LLLGADDEVAALASILEHDLEAIGQRTRPDAFDRALQLVELLRPFEVQIAQDQQRPAVADQFERPLRSGDAWRVARSSGFRHRIATQLAMQRAAAKNTYFTKRS